MCSFKNEDTQALEIQTTVNIEEKYTSLLGGKTVNDLQVAELVNMKYTYSRLGSTPDIF
jgi:hypothetical protein